MPRDGAIVLSDLQRDGLAVRCDACSRSGRYSVQRRLVQRGDLKLTVFLAEIAKDCPKRLKSGFDDVCKARFECSRDGPEKVKADAGLKESASIGRAAWFTYIAT
jgi:hypothetical protein